MSGEADQVDALQGDDDGNRYELIGEYWRIIQCPLDVGPMPDRLHHLCMELLLEGGCA